MKTLAIGFAVAAAFSSHFAFAATTTDGTMTPEGKTHSVVAAKPSHSYVLFLPSVAGHTFQQSSERDPAWFMRYQGEQASYLVNNGTTETSLSPPTSSVFPSQATRRPASLIIGWLPAKGSANTPGPYQPSPYQYASTGTKTGGCRAVDSTASNAVTVPEGDSKGLHLPAGWLLGMCLHY